uniref:Uncharacterized protein n=1 Tax=Rhizophora mucronata TaxID=61149 RepID=A0A2P2PXA2_RHIMU
MFSFFHRPDRLFQSGYISFQIQFWNRCYDSIVFSVPCFMNIASIGKT